MIVGCLGIAPVNSSFCTRDRLFAVFFADAVGAGLAADGALDVPVLAGADSVDWEVSPDELVVAGLVDVSVVLLCSTDGVSIVIVGTGTTGAITGALGMTFTLMGLTGLVGLVGLVTDLTHVSLVVIH